MEQSDGILSGQALKDELDKYEWSPILNTLRTYVIYRLKFKYYISPTAEKRLSGEQVDDIVHRAVESVWLEERVWDIHKEPDLLKHLKSIIDSQLYNGIIKSSQFQNQVTTDLFDLAEQKQASDNNEEVLNAKLAIEAMRKLLLEDKGASKVFDHFINGLPPREIAEETGIEVAEVNNILKRMKRKLGLIQY